MTPKSPVQKAFIGTIIILIHIIILVVAFVFYLNLKQQDVSHKWTESNSFLLSKLAIAQQEQNFQSAKQLAVTLAELPSVREQDAKGCSDLLARIMKGNPLYANLGVADIKGDNWCSAVPMDGPISVSDRSHFQEALKNKTFALGKYTIGRIVKKPVVHVAYPVMGKDDNVQGVVLIVLDLEWLNKMAEYTGLPEESHFGIFDSSGILLTHYPQREDWLGGKITDACLPHVDPESIYPEVFTTFSSLGPDNIKRVYTVSRLPDSLGKGIYFFVGIPEAFYSSVANQTNKNNLLLTSVFSIVLVATVFIDWKLLTRFNQQAKAKDI